MDQESSTPPTEEDLTGPREGSSRERKPPVPQQVKNWRIGAVIAVAAAVGLIIWAIVVGYGGKSSTSTAATSKPIALSLAGLKGFAGTLHLPLYWVGPRRNVTYELTQGNGGNVFVRYLPSGVKAGDTRTFLTIGTYPLANAFAVTHAISRKPGSVAIPLGTGAVGYHTPGNQTDAYVAFSGSDHQIEVYDSSPGVARRLVARGAVQSVPSSAPAGAKVTAITPAGLRSLSARLGQTIYWAGPERGYTYEIRQLASGFIYVRYLPKGVAVGDPHAYRTIATYPMSNAYAATQGLAKGSADHATLSLPGGGIGVYNSQSPAGNVYVAFSGSPYQVEVADPTPGGARKLVAAQRIVAAR
jgi:hypothetical protein